MEITIIYVFTVVITIIKAQKYFTLISLRASRRTYFGSYYIIHPLNLMKAGYSPYNIVRIICYLCIAKWIVNVMSLLL